WALHAALINRRDQRDLFDQAYHVFWRNPKFLDRMMKMMLPELEGEMDAPSGEELSRRVAEALAAGRDQNDRLSESEPEPVFDAAMTWSQNEVLREKDFEQMTTEEIDAAREAIRRLRLPIMEVPTRRFRSDPSGARADMRATLKAALRSGGDIIPLKFRKRQTRHPPLIVLCDISGSMERYSRMLLHFLHAITNDRDRVHTFLFGTRLSNVTRYLRYKDIDAALGKISDTIEDWSGGTRIGHCLHAFNRTWSRRVLAQGAVVLLISDGLDRDAGAGLAAEVDRLHRSCRRLIWLNPLLRYQGFEPKSHGIRAILPHVDDFRPVHNLESLMQLADILSEPGQRRHPGMSKWLEAAA
ncbi:MAG: VWA domain-containing protein, partial [Alphaproteobacteria bacterium]|nr:VWA domain-containing protein [Alphaproteobacteria bacterium]